MENAPRGVDGEDVPRATSPPAASSGVASGLGWFLGGAVLLIGIGAMMRWCFGTSVQGSFTASGPRVHTWTLVADACRSGEPDGFFGVDLTASETPRVGVRVIKDAVRGLVVQVKEDGPAGGSVLFSKDSSCAVLDGDVRRGNTATNDVQDMEGFLELNCRDGDDRVSGKASFDHCH